MCTPLSFYLSQSNITSTRSGFLLHLYIHLHAIAVNQLIDWLSTIKLITNYFDQKNWFGSFFFMGKMSMFCDSSLSLDVFVFQSTECLLVVTKYLLSFTFGNTDPCFSPFLNCYTNYSTQIIAHASKSGIFVGGSVG